MIRSWSRLVLLFMLCTVRAGFGNPVDPRIDEICHKVFTKPDGPGGAVAVIAHGHVVHEQCYGMSPDPKHPGKVTPTTPFYLASVSKQFTATCIMILAEHGKLNLDHDIREYLTEFPQYNAQRPIHVTDLLTMRSGLKEYPMDEPSVTRKKLTAWYGTVKLDAPTGTVYEYNNGGYVLLGFIIEQVSGQSMKNFLQQNVFGPLKMTHTTFGDGDTADAGVYSCLEDMLTYVNALTHSPVVSEKMMKLAWSRAHLDNGETIGYGFGWMVSADQHFIYHTGKWSGASTYVSLDLNTGVAVIVLSSIDDTAPAIGEAINELKE